MKSSIDPKSLARSSAVLRARSIDPALSPEERIMAASMLAAFDGPEPRAFTVLPDPLDPTTWTTPMPHALRRPAQLQTPAFVPDRCVHCEEPLGDGRVPLFEYEQSGYLAHLQCISTVNYPAMDDRLMSYHAPRKVLRARTTTLS